MTPTLALVAGGPQVTSQISLGVMILAAIIGLAGLAFLLYGARYKAAYEAEKAVTSSLETHRHRLELDLSEARTESERQRDLKHDALNDVATLRLQTDLTPVLKSMAESQSATLAALEQFASGSVHAVTARVAEMEDRLLARIEALQLTSEKQTAVLDALVKKANGYHPPEEGE